MSTANSPDWKLRAEANKMARLLKQAVSASPPPEMAEALRRAKANGDVMEVALVMDDKIIRFTIMLEAIRLTSRATLANTILMEMKSPVDPTEH